jgi:hypothetical protein
MKKQLLLFLLALLPLVASASADDAQIVIKQKSGNETILQLATNPVITFSGEDMVITNDFTTISIPLDDIDNYVASDGTTAIEPVTTLPQFSRGHVIFSGMATGSPVYVRTLDGKVVGKQAADASGKADVSLENLPKGTYIISSQNNSIKVINK